MQHILAGGAGLCDKVHRMLLDIRKSSFLFGASLKAVERAFRIKFLEKFLKSRVVILGSTIQIIQGGKSQGDEFDSLISEGESCFKAHILYKCESAGNID